MDFKDYVKLAMRTNREDRSFNDNLVNGIFGLVGETVELRKAARSEDFDSCIDELGDVYWYTALMFHTIGTAPSELSMDEKLLIEEGRLMNQIGAVSDHVKKHLFQGHAIDIEFISSEMTKLKYKLDWLCEELLVTPSRVMSRNIDKLKRRFPEGFDVDKSINREE